MSNIPKPAMPDELNKVSNVGSFLDASLEIPSDYITRIRLEHKEFNDMYTYSIGGVGVKQERKINGGSYEPPWW